MPLSRRRPVLRAAAIGGGAYAAGKRRQEAGVHVRAEQAQRADPIPPTEAPGRRREPSCKAVEMLERLGKLHEQGVLTDEEFASYKASLLNR